MIMDPGKARALVEWVNALAVGECVESLQGLASGQHFLAIQHLIDGDTGSNEELETTRQIYTHISVFLAGQYQTSIENKVDFEAIIDNLSEYEIGKVGLLFLTSSLLCVNNGIFVERATNLDVRVQHEIRVMVEYVIQPNHQLIGLDSSFSAILGNPLNLTGPAVTSTPQSESSVHRTSVRCTPIPHAGSGHGHYRGSISDSPVFAKGPSGKMKLRFQSPQVHSMSSSMVMSPVQDMVQSPHMANRIQLQQRDQRLKQLNRELSTERRLRKELEEDIQYKETALSEKECTVKDMTCRLQTAQREIRSLREQVELAAAPDIQGTEPTVHDRVGTLMQQLQTVRDANTHLEKENTELYEQIHSCKDMMSQVESLKSQLAQYQLLAKHQEWEIADYKLQLEGSQRQMAALSEEKTEVDRDLRRITEVHQQQIMEWRQEKEKSFEAGECLGDIAEKVLKDQLEDMKANLEFKEEALTTQLRQLQCQVAQMQKDLDESHLQSASLRASLDITQQELSIEQEKVSELTGSLETAHQQREAMRARHDELEDRISSLEQQLAASHNKEQKLVLLLQEEKSTAGRLHAELQQTQQHVSGLVKEKQQLEERARQMEEHYHGLTQQLDMEKNQLRGELGSAQQILVEKEAHVTALQDHTEQLQEQLRDTETTAQQLRKELQESRDSAAVMDQNLQDAKSRGSSLEQQLEQETREQEALRELLGEVQRQAEVLKGQLAESQQNAAEVEAQRQQSRTQLASLQEEASQVHTAMATLQGQLGDFQQERSHLERELTATRSHEAQLEGELQSGQTATAEMQAQVEVAQADIARLTAEVVQQTEQYETLQQQHSAAQTEMTCVQAALKDAEAVNEEQVARLNAACQSHAALAASLKETQDAAAALQEELSNSQANVSMKGQDICGLQDDLSSKQVALDAAQALVSSLQEEAELQQQSQADLQAQHAALSEEHQATCSRLEEAQHKVEIMQGSLETSTQHTANLQAELGAVQQTCHELEHQLQAAKEACVELQREVKAGREKKEALSRQLENTCSQLDATQQELTGLREYHAQEKGQVQVDLSQAQHQFHEERQRQNVEIKDLQCKLADIHNQMEVMSRKMQEDLNTSQGKNEQLEQQVSLLKQEVTAYQKDILAMRSKLSDSEQMVNNLEFELSQKQNTWSEAEASLKQQLTSEQASRGNLQQQLASTRFSLGGKVEHLTSMQDKLESLKDELEEATSSRAELEARVLCLDTAATSLREELVANEASARERELSLAREVAQHEEELEQLQLSLEESAAERKQLIEQRDIVITERDEVQQRLEAMEAETQKSAKSHAAQVSQLEQRIESVREEQSAGTRDHHAFAAQLRQELQEQEAVVTELHSQVETLEGDKAQLTQNQQEAETRICGYQQQLTELEARLSDHEQTQEQLQATQQQATMLSTELDHTRQAVARLQEEAAQGRSSLAQQQSELQHRRAEHVALEQRWGQAQTSLEETTTALEAAKSRLESEQQEAMTKVMALQQNLAEVQREYSVQNDQHQQAISHQGAQVAKWQDSATSLQDRLQQLDREKADLKCWEASVRTNMVDLEGQLKTQENTCQDLRSQLQRKAAAHTEMETTHKELETTHKELEAAHKELVTTHKELEAAHKELEAAHKELEAAHKELEAAHKETEEELDQERAEKEEIKERLTQRLGTLHETLQAREEGMCGLQADLEDGQTKYAEVQERLSLKLVELQSKDARLASLEEELDHLAQVKLDLEKLRAEKEALVCRHFEELAEVRTELDMKEDACKKLQEAVTTGNAELKKTQDQAKQQLAELLDEREAATCFEAKLKKVQTELDAERDTTEREVLALHGQITRMEEKMTDLRANHDELAGEHAEAKLKSRTTCKQMEDKQNELELHVLALNDKLAQVDEERGRLNDALRDAQVSNEEHNQDLRLLEDQYEHLKDFHKSKEAECISLSSKIKSLETAKSRLEKEVHSLMEREAKRSKTIEHEMQQAAEMNSRLRKQLSQRDEESRHQETVLTTELERLREQLQAMKEHYEDQLGDADSRADKRLQTEVAKWKEHVEGLEANIAKNKERLAKAASDNKRLQEAALQYKARAESRKDQVDTLTSDLEYTKEMRGEAQRQMMKADEKVDELTLKVHQEEATIKRLNTQLRSAEAQLDHANRLLRCQSGIHNDVFKRPNAVTISTPQGVMHTVTKMKKETTFDAKLNLNDLISEDSSKYDLRSRSPQGRSRSATRSMEALSLANSRHGGSTPTSQTRKLDTVPASPSNGDLSLEDLATSTSTRTRPLTRSTHSTAFEPTRSANVPHGTGELLSMDEEPDVVEFGDLSELQRRRSYEPSGTAFDWDRMSELQRRNTLCLPHMRSSYPVETQTKATKELSDDLIKTGAVPMAELAEKRQKGRKRTSSSVLDDSLEEDMHKELLEKLAGLHTPGYNPKNRVGTRRHGTPSRKSPRTVATRTPPSAGRQRRNRTKGTPQRKTPQRNENAENLKSKLSSKVNEAFNIGFTPKKSSRLLRLMGSGRKKDPNQLKKKPLADINQK